MQGLVQTALEDPWGALQVVLDGPLHPGGTEATDALLDRADVAAGTRVLDVGCGAGGALRLSRERGATAWGLDRQPATDDGRVVRGDLRAFPVRDATLDVVLAECVLCLSPDLPRSLAEANRTLRTGGRLALSDIIVEGDLADVPEELTTPLCLTGTRDRETLLDAVATAGFEVEDVRDHQDDLLAMRDRIQSQVDYERLLRFMGSKGKRLLDGIETLEDAAESGEISYVSLVATAD
jgi:SAM-dependent methyltransferase